MNSLLDSKHLDGVLRVLEDCQTAPNLETFRHSTVEGMARHLGYRHTLFLAGPTVELCRQDRGMVGHGISERMIESYLETFYRHNVFAEPPALNLIRRQPVISLDQIPRLRTEGFARFTNDWLFRNGIHAELAVNLRLSPTSVVMMGVMDPESGAFGPVDLQLVELLRRHLGNLVRWHTDELIRTVNPTGLTASRLTPRQADVVALVAKGLTNTEIAREFFIGVDTVKKHISQALIATGCRSRTQLGLYWTVQHR
ncbi:response regulator transcription factor [Nocardia sp. CA-107356]|uniref:response regulator transcription factor n=1 Tax=Nocardia sp. CA-107356 TaxID=3239972 RepID=UPI003D942A4C